MKVNMAMSDLRDTPSLFANDHDLPVLLILARYSLPGLLIIVVYVRDVLLDWTVEYWTSAMKAAYLGAYFLNLVPVKLEDTSL